MFSKSVFGNHFIVLRALCSPKAFASDYKRFAFNLCEGCGSHYKRFAFKMHEGFASDYKRFAFTGFAPSTNASRLKASSPITSVSRLRAIASDHKRFPFMD
jgi:hypothetical protein